MLRKGVGGEKYRESGAVIDNDAEELGGELTVDAEGSDFSDCMIETEKRAEISFGRKEKRGRTSTRAEIRSE